MNHHPTLIFLIINLILIVIPSSFSQNDTLSSVKCPLNFSLIRGIWNTSTTPYFSEQTYCDFAMRGLQIVVADYLRRTGSFVRPLNTSESCWKEAQIVAQDYFPNFDVRKNCGFETDWISVSCCKNITNRKEFESKVDARALDYVESACNQRLDAKGCASCTTTVSLVSLVINNLNGSSVGNITGCIELPFLYALAFTQDYAATVNCLFMPDVNYWNPKTNHKSNLTMTSIMVIVVVTLFLIAIAIGLLWCYRSKKLQKLKRNPGPKLNGVSALNSFTESTTLVKYTIDDIKEATRNFALENMIGRGGFGNVYKGVLVDGSEVAVKRFKNCSAAADASFRHEVEVIGSVQHVNLVALRGYCSAVTPYEGYQRIIVCDLIKNGSLHDHLFGEYASRGRLSWPIRRRIGLGTARGLDYLHHGAQTTIIHRDIKASNILLDEDFEAKLADFGLAKFAPEGATHLSTRIAGTMGYVAPEYALYGQLTERSDVYSFGVVLLELLSGRKALIGVGDEQPTLLADWAWSLVSNGKPLEVIDSEMSECDPPEIMEKYVLVAVLSSHPQLHARPTMDQVLKMLDTDLPVPQIPERPIPLVALIENIKRSATDSGSGDLFSPTPTGHQTSTFEMDGRSITIFEMEEEYAAKEEVEGEEEDEMARLSSGKGHSTKLLS